MKIALLAVVAAAALLQPSTSEPSPVIVPVPGGVSGEGVTTRYWDCCKPACAWPNVVHTRTGIPVASCEKDGVTRIDDQADSGCGDDGVAFACTNTQPKPINSTMAFGFVGASIIGGMDLHLCCACVLLNFQGGLAGKQLVGQITNTGPDLGTNHFDIAMPGGGVGIWPNGCNRQWDAWAHGWGHDWSDVTSISDCDKLPTDLQEGCRFQFDFMEGVPNPPVSFYQVECPAEIVAISGCEL